MLGISDRQTRQRLGNINFTTLKRDVDHWAIIGYEIHNQFWKRGFGKEAVRAASISGFETLHHHRIEAVINLNHYASIASTESVGMKKGCVRRSFFYENEQWVNHLIYVVLPQDLSLVEKSPYLSESVGG